MQSEHPASIHRGTGNAKTPTGFFVHLNEFIEQDTLIPMKYLERITFNPSQCGGRPCIRGMRIRVKDVLDLLAAGVGEPEILRDFPYLQAEDIRACLEYAAGEVDHPVLVALGQ
jgi:uncharacterized protein (DUF433 family)